MLAGGGKTHPHRVLVAGTGDPARRVGKFFRAIAHEHSAAAGVHLLHERPAGLVGLVEIAVHDFGPVALARSADRRLHLVILIERLEEPVGGVRPRLVVAFRNLMVDDRLFRQRRLDDFRSVHRAVVDMAEIEIFERNILVVREGDVDGDFRRAFAERHLGRERIVAGEAPVVDIGSADGDKGAALVGAEFHPRFTVAGYRQFRMPDMIVFGRGIAHRRKPAVHHKAAV